MTETEQRLNRVTFHESMSGYTTRAFESADGSNVIRPMTPTVIVFEAGGISLVQQANRVTATFEQLAGALVFTGEYA